MRHITRTAMAVGAGGAILVGGVAAAAPAFARNGPGPAATNTQDFGYRAGAHGAGTGVRCDPAQWPAGTLTSQQKTTLAAMAQEEKLARDLYAAFAARYDVKVFSQIAMAETRHLDAIRTVLKAYGIADPTAGQAAGTFTSAAVQSEYNRMLAQGKASLDAALRVGQSVEQADITDLGKALDGLTAPRLENVYTNLLNASKTHLAAFEYWLAR